MHHIISVVILAVFDGEVAVAVHLTEPCKAGAHFEFEKFPVFIVGVINGKKGTGCDEAHISFQHVEKLRKFVDLKFADDLAHFGHVRVFVGNDGVIFVEFDFGAAHGTEFVAIEFFALFSRPELFEHDFAAVFRFDGDRDGDHDRAYGDERDERDQKIDGILEPNVCFIHFISVCGVPRPAERMRSVSVPRSAERG